jgi:ribonucleoside-triphosphate reductase
MFVLKRNKKEQAFQFEKIKKAIGKAFDSVRKNLDPEKDSERLAELDENYKSTIACMESRYDDILDDAVIDVEDIQDDVKECLMANDPKVAEAYVIWAYVHKIRKNDETKVFREFKMKLMALDVVNQNANVDEYSFGGRIGEAGRVLTKDDALMNCMSKKSRLNHLNNEIYIHDLDSYSSGQHNCLTVPIDNLLKNGFKVRQTDVRPANSVNTAFQLVAVIFQVQSLQQFGGVACNHLDWTMVPYVRKSFTKHLEVGLVYIESKEEYKNHGFRNWCKENKEDGVIKFDDVEFKNEHPEAWDYAMYMTISELNQAVEGMFHNLNTLQSRSGNQLPFSSINFGTCTLPEGRIVIKALLEGSINGTGRYHRTAIFPCSIFQYMKGVNDREGTPNYDLYRLALQSTAKRIYPNYANVDWSGNAGYDVNDPRTYFSTMGCRTANGWDINGFGQLKDGRGNICPVTIILPTLAMEAKETTLKSLSEGDENFEAEHKANFIKLLTKKIGEAKDMLIERFNWIAAQRPSSAKFMWENNTMAGYNPKEGVISALKHGTLAVGNLGLAECLQIILHTDHTTDNGMEFAKEIYTLFQKKCKQYKEKYKLNFGVYNTPAESLCHTALKRFKNKYGIIKNVSDREYFTNSMHVPVWHKITPFEKIDIESELTGFSSAGCITYVELDSSVKNNLDALETVVNYAMDKDIPYFAINIPIDNCMDCGYSDEMNDTCPECGGHNIQHLRRVTGYLTGDYKTAFNAGKVDETEDRVKHIKEL